MAAVLAAGPEALLSHRSAGQLWGITPWRHPLSEVTKPTKSRPRSGIRVYRSLVPSDEKAIVSGVPTTSTPRTLFDLSTVLTERQLEKALNEAEVRGLTDRLSIPDLLERHPGRRGSATMRRLLATRTETRGITRSKLEDRFVALLDDFHLPRPRLNAAIAVCGRFFEADCVWDEQRLIVELDGHAVHGTRRAFERDRERDRLLQSAGWRVVRITWRQLRDDAPALIADLRRLLRQGAGAPTL